MSYIKSVETKQSDIDFKLSEYPIQAQIWMHLLLNYSTGICEDWN